MDATMENKMGLPPPYEATVPCPAPPPSYFGSNPPPPAGYNTPATAPPAPQTTVTTPTFRGQLGPGRSGYTCPKCNKHIVSRVRFVANNRTHIMSAALCIVAGCCCGCFIPYCMRSCKSANHFCPQCKSYLGTYQP